MHAPGTGTGSERTIFVLEYKKSSDMWNALLLNPIGIQQQMHLIIINSLSSLSHRVNAFVCVLNAMCTWIPNKRNWKIGWLCQPVVAFITNFIHIHIHTEHNVLLFDSTTFLHFLPHSLPLPLASSQLQIDLFRKQFLFQRLFTFFRFAYFRNGILLVRAAAPFVVDAIVRWEKRKTFKLDDLHWCLLMLLKEMNMDWNGNAWVIYDRCLFSKWPIETKTMPDMEIFCQTIIHSHLIRLSSYLKYNEEKILLIEYAQCMRLLRVVIWKSTLKLSSGGLCLHGL